MQDMEVKKTMYMRLVTRKSLDSHSIWILCTRTDSQIQKDIKNAKNWTYLEQEDCFICPNGRKVTFKKYQNKKNQSGYEQSFKIYECEDCTDCPLKAQCTKAKGNRQVHWNTVFEEMKAKAKTALECEEKAAIYARRKVEVESVFGHIKGNRSFRRFSLRGLDKVHVEFGIVALAHNILKVAGIRQLLSEKNRKNTKASGEKRLVFRHLLILGTYRTAPFYILLFCANGRFDKVAE
jgi:Transposase DDE domain